ncbi:MAG: DUF2809 domain-containing protein [Bacteroidota bacterium]
MKNYFTIFILLLVTEVAIAYFQFTQFIRGFVGDVLVIPLLYTFIRAITRIPGKRVLLIVLLIAFGIELMQLFSVADRLQIQHPLARIALGNTFDGWDLVAYLFGILPVLLIEKIRAHGKD